MQARGIAADTTERTRVEAMIEALAGIHSHGEGLADLAHDARNMVTALSLYCDLLEQPGVLASSHRHYASELRLVAEGSRRLVEKLSMASVGDGTRLGSAPGVTARQGRLFAEAAGAECAPGGGNEWIRDIGEELKGSGNLLSALAGPSIAVRTTVNGGACGVRMMPESFIRALVNLVRNAAESIQNGGGAPGAGRGMGVERGQDTAGGAGRGAWPGMGWEAGRGAGRGTIAVTLNEKRDETGEVGSVVLSVEDSGPGIPEEWLERVFERGFTTHPEASGRVPGTRARGLGLAITRSMVEAAGGTIRAEKAEAGGARMVVELPVTSDVSK